MNKLTLVFFVFLIIIAVGVSFLSFEEENPGEGDRERIFRELCEATGGVFVQAPPCECPWLAQCSCPATRCECPKGAGFRQSLGCVKKDPTAGSGSPTPAPSTLSPSSASTNDVPYETYCAAAVDCDWAIGCCEWVPANKQVKRTAASYCEVVCEGRRGPRPDIPVFCVNNTCVALTAACEMSHGRYDAETRMCVCPDGMRISRGDCGAFQDGPRFEGQDLDAEFAYEGKVVGGSIEEQKIKQAAWTQKGLSVTVHFHHGKIEPYQGRAKIKDSTIKVQTEALGENPTRMAYISQGTFHIKDLPRDPYTVEFYNKGYGGDKAIDTKITT